MNNISSENIGVLDTELSGVPSKEIISISSIKIEHFKKIDDETLCLNRPVTYLVGTNRCGKSSFLQAAMMMIAAAQQFQGTKSRQEVVPVLEKSLRYCPTHDFESLGHKKRLDSNENGYKAQAKLNFLIGSEPFHYGVSFQKARGAANIRLKRDHNTEANVTRIIQRHLSGSGDKHFNLSAFAVYVPGISGIAKKEVKIQKMEVYQAMFGGDAGSVLRNILLLINDKKSTKENKKEFKTKELKSLEKDISALVGDIKFEIVYDSNSSSDLEVLIIRNDHTFPIELCSLGELQLIQIIAYWRLLKPRLLLLDEPDSHLHADAQGRLVKFLVDRAESENTKVIVATHSPQVVRNIDLETASLQLIQEGKIADIPPDKIECLMHLGALDAYDKQIFILTEDADSKNLEALLDQPQWEGIKGNYKVIPYNGRKKYMESTSAG